jgi:hypothetical protein
MMGPALMLAVAAGSVPVTGTFAVTGPLTIARPSTPTGSVTPARPSILAGPFTIARPSILAGPFTIARPSILAGPFTIARPSILAGPFTLQGAVALAWLTVFVVVAPAAGAVGLLRTVRAVPARRIVGLPVGWSARPMARSVAAVRPLLTRTFTSFASSFGASLRGTL